MIDENGNSVLKLTDFEFLGILHNGLASFRDKKGYGFVNSKRNEIIRPQYDLVDDFLEGLCLARDEKNKHSYIDSLGKVVIPLQFHYATKFENGVAKTEINNLCGAIDKHGKIIEESTHKYAT